MRAALPVVLLVERAQHRHGEAARLDVLAHEAVDVVAVRREQGDAARAERLEGRERGGDRRGARHAGARRADPGEHLLLADHHRGGGAAERDHIERQAGQDDLGRLGEARLHRRERRGRDRRLVQDAALVEGDAREIEQPAKLVLHGLIGREHDQADRGA